MQSTTHTHMNSRTYAHIIKAHGDTLGTPQNLYVDGCVWTAEVWQVRDGVDGKRRRELAGSMARGAAAD